MRKTIIILLLLFGVFLAIGCASNKGSSPNNTLTPNNTVTPVGYQYGQMGPGMMGSGMMGSGMMGSGMMGNVMAIYYPDSKPITQDEAHKIIQNFSRQYYGPNIEIEDFMAFSSNYYAVLKDANGSKNIAETLVDRYSGSAYPEPGPNMMWNTLYGAGRTDGGSGYDLAGAQKLAEKFLASYLPGAKIQESHAMPGYYTFDFGRNETESMLSVNAYSGQIWVHTWHGSYLGGMNVTS